VRPLFRVLAALILVSIGMSAACGDPAGPRAPAYLTIRLHDAPGDVQAAVVTIDQIYLQGDGGRTVLRDTPVTVDLTTLTNTSTLLVDNVTVPSGEFGQLRFVISGGYLQVEGPTGASQIFASSPDYAGLPTGATVDGALQMPSFSTSGLKVNLPSGLTLPSGSAVSLMVDFDVSQSFGHLAGSSDMWVMHPVINAAGVTMGTTLAVTLVLGSGVTLPTGVTLGDFQATLAAASAPGTVLGIEGFTDLGSGTFGASFGFVAPGDYVVDIVQPSGLTGHTIDPAVPFAFTAVVGPGTTLAFTVK
jgi:Domain of unknown function (DUF4382)